MNIGIAMIDMELTETLLAYPMDRDFSLIEITKKEQIADLDGLILPMSGAEQLPKVIDWLLASQRNLKLFSWVFSSEKMDTEDDILRQLGVNEVVEEERHIPRLFLSIENLLNKVSYLMSKKKMTQESVLNGRDQSLFVDENQSIHLTRIEYLILNELMKKMGTTLTYKELMGIGWPRDTSITKFNLANTIFHLRKKVEASHNYSITNVRSIGYKLTLLQSN